MHAFARKGLLLSAATGTLVMGYAGTAAAQDSATTRGAAADSPGAVSGNVAQVPADVPIQVCGDAGAAGGAVVGSEDNDCWTDHTKADATGYAADSPGAISGNVGSVAANVPVQACGLAAGALSADVTSYDNDCVDDGTFAKAFGAAADSPGLISGNVLQVAADVPVQACGDSAALLGFGVGAKDNHCVNGGPRMTPPPPVDCPPPPPENCPPPELGRTVPQPPAEIPAPTTSTPPQDITPPSEIPGPPDESTPPDDSTPPQESTPPTDIPAPPPNVPAPPMPAPPVA